MNEMNTNFYFQVPQAPQTVNGRASTTMPAPTGHPPSYYTQKAQESEQLRQSVMQNNYRKSMTGQQNTHGVQQQIQNIQGAQIQVQPQNLNPTNFDIFNQQVNQQAGQQAIQQVGLNQAANQPNTSTNPIIYQSASNSRLPQQMQSTAASSSSNPNNLGQQNQQNLPFQEISSRCSSTSNYSGYADSGAYTSSPNISPTNDQANGAAQVQIEPDRPIGYGAFGVVWAVTDPRDRQRVALKKMPYVFSNLVSAKRVYRELKILASVKHDNVLKAQDILLPPENLHDFKEVYVVTDLLQSDLHKIIISSQPLTIDHVTIFIYQVLRGLKFLHGLGIIHRDIKPGNLLVNSNCLLKVCDFGLSREYGAMINKQTPDSPLNDQVVDNTEGFCAMTQEVITQYYRPPELLMGATKYNLAIDIWSVGCILVELITRRILFQAPSPLAQLDVMCSILGRPVEGEKSLSLGCKSAKQHVLSKTAAGKSFGLRSNIVGHAPATPAGILYLAESMLDWDPKRRPTVTVSLQNGIFDDARIRFHTCMCSCCPRINQKNNSEQSWAQQQAHQQQIQMLSKTHENLFEPLPTKSFNFDNYLSTLNSLEHVKMGMSTWIRSQPCGKRLPLCINLNSPTFKQFQKSTVAQSNELPPSPEKWK